MEQVRNKEQGRESPERCIWVIDEAGEEIEGSRRPASAFVDRKHMNDAIDRLRGMIGDGCSIADNVDSWAEYWRERDAAEAG